MRPYARARRERKSDPQKLRIDRNDERVCVRIVPQSRLYAECFGWVVLRPKHPGYTTDPGAGMSGLQVDSTQLNPGHRRRCQYQPRSLRGVAMRRVSQQSLVCLGVLLLGLQLGSESTLLASWTGRASALTEDERATLLRYANDTWRSFERLTLPSGLPADNLSRDGEGWSNPLSHTSPTNIAAYLWSTLAAERLHLIGSSEATSRLDRTLATLAGMDRTHGLFFNMLDPRTGAVLKVSPFDSSRVEPYLSAVDNAWLAVALTMVANSELSLRERAGRLLEPIDFRFFYDPYDAADPVRHPGQLYVGYQTDDHTFYGHYGMLNTEARIASYLGIARGQLPPEHYYRMFRTLPENLGPQQQSPRGTTRDYYGVKVFEGSYEYRGARIVPSWGGSMFEALMVTLFVPEDVWAPRSWGINHPLYVRAQIAHGLEEVGYGYWGFSPAASPRGGYEVYGVKALGTYTLGYFSYEIGPPVLPPLMPHSTRFTHGVVTPHASFLALRYAPHEAVANLRALSKAFPIYGPLGFQDSVDVSAGVVAASILTLDQGMIMAAIANALADDAMQHIFSDGQMEQVVRPLIAQEDFSAGPPGHLVWVQPTVAGAQDGGGKRIQVSNAQVSRTAHTVAPGSIAP